MAKHLPDFRVGDTYRLKIQYPEGTNLNGYRHWLTVRPDFGATPVLEVESLFGDHSADELNIAYLEATPVQTALITAGRYVYDLQASSQNGDIITLLPPVADYKDKLFIAPQVTEDS